MSTIEPGYFVAITLKENCAPLRVYVGEVQEIDERGVRITLMDWILEAPVSWDLFIPWESITSALVATPDHVVDRFPDSAAKWQDNMQKRTNSEV